MKRILSVVLSVLLVLSVTLPADSVARSFEPATQAMSPIDLSAPERLPSASGYRFDYLPPPETWKAFVGLEQPAKLKGVTYKLKDGVRVVDTSVTDQIRSAGEILADQKDARLRRSRVVSEGGFISKTLLQGLVGAEQVQPGTIFADPSTGTAFKVVGPESEGETTYPYSQSYGITQPQIGELVDSLDIPEQNLQLTRANITGFSDPRIVDHIVPDAVYEKYVLEKDFLKFKHLKMPLIPIIFPEGFKITGYLGDGETVTVELSGGLGIGDLGLDAAYNPTGGYHFGLTQSQEVFLQARVGIEVHEEVRIPIYGIDIDFGVGSISGGIFLVLTLDGKIQIDIQARQWATTTVGVAGHCFFGLPVTATPYFRLPPDKMGMTGNLEISGRIDGAIKAGAMVGINLFGLDIAGAGVFVGVGITITGDAGPPAKMDVELYGLVQLYVTLLSKRFDILNLHLTIFKRRQADMGSYLVKVQDADAYQDLVGGIVQQTQQEGTSLKWVPAPGVPVDVKVQPAWTGGAQPEPVLYRAADHPSLVTGANGEYHLTGVDLKQGDLVSVQLEGGKYECDPIGTTFPFGTLTTEEADYFNDYALGQVVPVRVRNWDSATGDPDLDTHMIYYAHGAVDVQVRKKIAPFDYSDGQKVTVTTDAYGNYDTRSLGAGAPASDGQPLDIQPTDQFLLHLEKDGYHVTSKPWTKPTIALSIRRTFEEVPGSHVRTVDAKGRTVDSAEYIERLYLANVRGTKVPTDVTLSYQMFGFSTQDLFKKYTFIYNPAGGLEGTIPYYSTASMAPITQPVVLKAAPAPAFLPALAVMNGTAMADNRVVVRWVWQNHSNPTVITSPPQYGCTTDGGTFQVTATGVAPFTYQLTGAPAGVSVDSAGVIAVPAGTPAGTYAFTLTVTSQRSSKPIQLPGTYPTYKEDDYPPVSQAFALTVVPSGEPTPTPAPTSAATPTPSPSPTLVPSAPVITSADHATLKNGQTFLCTATGTTPITWEIGRVTPPEVGIKIDANTGLLEVEDVPLGTYTFLVRAKNAIGTSEWQSFTLTVVSATRGFATSGLAPIDRYALSPGYDPVNTYLLVNDDKEDLYTLDALTVDGSSYVKWDGILTATYEGVTIQLVTYDGSPLNDHHMVPLTQEQKEALKQLTEKLAKEVTTPGYGFDIDDGFGGFGGSFDDLIGGGLEGYDGFGLGGVIDVGGLIQGIQGLGGKGGDVGIGLGGAAGTILPGSVFGALQGAGAGASLTIDLGGATIKFQGGPGILNPGAGALLDFGFTADAPDAAAMEGAAGPGAQSFSYAFAHGGALPGMGTFSVSTGMAPGTKVNVYKFDAASGAFALIASGKSIGQDGQVTYQNQSMSEYLVTTATIPGATLSDVYRVNNPSVLALWWFWVAGAGLLALIAAGTVLMIRTKRKTSEGMSKQNH